MLDQLNVRVLGLLADVPSLGQGEQPPGFDKFMKVVKWGFYLVGVFGVIGMLVVGATMMVSHRRGGYGEHGSSLGMVFAGCALAAMSVPLVNSIL